MDTDRKRASQEFLCRITSVVTEPTLEQFCVLITNLLENTETLIIICMYYNICVIYSDIKFTEKFNKSTGVKMQLLDVFLFSYC